MKPGSDDADAHIKQTETTRQSFYELTVTLADLVRALSNARDQLGPPPELIPS